MNVTLIDRIGSVVLQNGIMRVDCFTVGPNGQETHSGKLLIPAAQASTILQALVGAAQELDRRLREQAQQARKAATEGTNELSAEDKKAAAEG